MVSTEHEATAAVHTSVYMNVQVQTTPGDPHTFLSSSEDGTIRCFDTREGVSCAEENCGKVYKLHTQTMA